MRKCIHKDKKNKSLFESKPVHSLYPMLYPNILVEGTYTNAWHQCKIFYEKTGDRNSALFYELWKISFY